MRTEKRKERVALLLVHGIGEPPPGAFLSQFREGFARLLGATCVHDVVRQDPVEPTRRIHAAAIELDDRTVMLYEVHWSDLITGNMARASFDPMDLFLLAWFPWFNKKLHLQGFDRLSDRQVAGWTCRLVSLSVLFKGGWLLRTQGYSPFLARVGRSERDSRPMRTSFSALGGNAQGP